MMSLWKKILFATLLTVVFLFSVNALCALGERLAYGAFWGNNRPKGLYIHKNGERPKLKPGANLNGLLYQISINSLGLRGPELLKPKPDQGIRIWAIGGSTTFDIYAATDRETWPALLQEKLQSSLPQSTIEVINAGIPGEIYWGSISDFEQHQPTVNPDYIILYHGPNDLRQVGAPPVQKPGSHMTGQKGETEGMLFSLLSNQEWAILRVLKRWLQPMQPIRSHWKGRSISKNMIREIENRVIKLLRSAQSRNVRPILATHPLKAESKDTGDIAQARVAESAQHLQLTPEAVIKAFEDYNAMIRSVSQRYSVPLADIRHAVGPDADNWGDATHFRHSGSELASKSFHDVLLKDIQSPAQIKRITGGSGASTPSQKRPRQNQRGQR